MTLTDRISIRLDPATLRRLDAYCARESKHAGYPVTRTDAIRAMIERGVRV